MINCLDFLHLVLWSVLLRLHEAYHKFLGNKVLPVQSSSNTVIRFSGVPKIPRHRVSLQFCIIILSTSSQSSLLAELLEHWKQSPLVRVYTIDLLSMPIP